MTGGTDPSKRIPKSLGTGTRLIGTYSLTDLVVAASPGVVVLLLTRVILPPSSTLFGHSLSTYTAPVVVIAILGGGVFVYITPRHVSSLDWLAQFAQFVRNGPRVDHEAAKEYTQVERVYPELDVIERADGAFVGAIRVDPPNMALATDDEWAAKAGAFEDFVNTTVEFPIQIYSRTRSFPADEYLDHYRGRLDDPDVESNPRLRRLLEQYVAWYDRELAERQTTIRDHYVLVTVRPEDVHYEYAGLLQRLASVPVVGTFVQLYCAPPEKEERVAAVVELDDRLGRVDRGLRAIEGCSTRRVSATEFARIVAEYWTGTEFEYRDPDRVFRTTGVVHTAPP